MNRDTFKAKGNPPMSNDLAAYVATYINEELIRTFHTPHNPLQLVDSDMILKAVDAYEGGAR